MSSGGARATYETVPPEVIKANETSMIKNMSMLKGRSLKATSQIHRFKPPVSLLESLQWIYSAEGSEVANIDFIVIYENGNSIEFEEATFKHYESMDGDDD
eukprot:TRINITY_DN30824_c0_g1_i1.p1 TRINITY_DN30824_c0_g1~~TRINITY_DN30824_c0_g1_i1.p1  ORF type:complete len:101 (-),score=1.35 TRINITY_DN30824_c0_g1_i1:43-345(-)